MKSISFLTAKLNELGLTLSPEAIDERSFVDYRLIC